MSGATHLCKFGWPGRRLRFLTTEVEKDVQLQKNGGERRPSERRDHVGVSLSLRAQKLFVEWGACEALQGAGDDVGSSFQRSLLAQTSCGSFELLMVMGRARPFCCQALRLFEATLQRPL